MKVLIAIDSFKGSMSSVQAGNAAAEGIRKVFPEAEIIIKPLADGGEGTVDALVEGLGGLRVQIPVSSPLGDTVEASYGIVNSDTAVIEIAQASGITLIRPDQLNPWKANTFGTGQLILDAQNRGIRKFIIGLGGSATTEGGIGLLSCLGAEFFDKENKKLLPEFSSLKDVHRISLEKMPKALEECVFEVACDVDSPLYGEKGAVAVFGKQKGVKEEEISEMDEAMKNYAQVVEKTVGRDHRFTDGAGAAGGLGFAFLSFFPNTRLKPGFEIISELINLERDLKGCDIVLTGEGRLDSQTALGKVPIGLARLARENGVKKVIAVAGSVSDRAGLVNQEGITAFFSILRGVSTLKEAMRLENAQKNMELTVEQIFRLL